MNTNLCYPLASRIFAGLVILLLSVPLHSADFIDLAVGDGIVCGLERDGSVECTAPATLIERATPPVNLPALVVIEAGNNDVCGIDTEGVVHCWGSTLAGSYEAPADMLGFESLSVGTSHWCGITATRNIHCGGTDAFGESSPPEPFTAYDQVLARWQSTCGLRSDKSVHCWGDAGPNRNSMAPFAGPLNYMMPLSNTSCGIDTDARVVCNGEPVPGMEGSFQNMVADFYSLCGVQTSGRLACVIDPERDISSFRDVVINGAALDDVPTQANYQMVDGRYTGLTCALSYNGDIDCWGRRTENLRLPGTQSELPLPESIEALVYGGNTIELVWRPEQREYYEAPTIRAYEVWRDGELLITTEGTSFLDDSLTPGIDYRYQVRSLGFDDASFSQLSDVVVANTAPALSTDELNSPGMSAPDIVDDYIRFGGDGWFQVLHSQTYNEVCAGGTGCSVPDGVYIIINHTTGERWEDVVVGTGELVDLGNDSSVTPVTAVSVAGDTIRWPNDGWYQVQSTTSYETVCQGVRFCIVEPGTYTVINHTIGTRWESIRVGAGGAGSETPGAPSVAGNTIQWNSNDWYQVQNASDYQALCEGGSSCDVPSGNYNVINLTTGERWLVSVE